MNYENIKQRKLIKKWKLQSVEMGMQQNFYMIEL